MMIDLPTILTEIRQEAERLMREGCDPEQAISQAIDSVIGRAAFSQAVTPHETRLMMVISQVGQETGRPVSTYRICAEVGTDYFATYYHLRNLERRHLLHRPAGPRSGWKVA